MLNILRPAFLSLFIVILSSCASKEVKDQSSSEPPVIRFSRYFSITTCYKGRTKCIGPVVKGLEKANVEKKAKIEKWGDEPAALVQDAVRIEENGVLFSGEVRISKKASSDTYYIFLILRSGSTVIGHGAVRALHVKDLTSFDSVTVIDQPIHFDQGTLRAQLTVGPYLKITN
ncbi:MAG: hypothetical protein AB7F86_18360 [Bdellovibrionales bacterium]